MSRALVVNCSAPHYNLGASKLADENVHTQREADGRLAGSAFIVPMCAAHRALLTRGLGTKKFEALYQIDLAAEAIDTQLSWRQHVGTTHGAADAARADGSEQRGDPTVRA